jgi:fatty-acid desaturase
MGSEDCFMLEFVVAFFVLYLWHALGVTIGYHRLLSHRSFKCPKLVEYFWVLGGYLAFEGSPIWWAAMHRAHHRYVDTPLDPHSPRYGIKHAYYGWMGNLGYPSHVDPNVVCRDLVKDPVYRFLEQDRLWPRSRKIVFWIGFGFRLMLLVVFGWQVTIASALAAVAVLQIPLLLNVVCHIPKLGYKTYETSDNSVNVWWVALLACGEGWHNNHHAFPGSARTGMKFYEFDLSWLILRTLKLFGLVTKVNDAKQQLAKIELEPVPVPITDNAKIGKGVWRTRSQRELSSRSDRH